MITIKRIGLLIVILLTIGIFSREWIYSQTVNYISIGPRTSYPATNTNLSHYIESSSQETDLEIPEIIKLGLSLTSQQLNFTAEKNHNDPNKLITSRTAHCVGYASFFATTCNYLLEKNNLNEDWIAKPHIGQLHIFGTNIHKYLDSPFLKNHDFVTIENKTTGEILAVDPTIHDYLAITFISYDQ